MEGDTNRQQNDKKMCNKLGMIYNNFRQFLIFWYHKHKMDTGNHWDLRLSIWTMLMTNVSTLMQALVFLFVVDMTLTNVMLIAQNYF